MKLPPQVHALLKEAAVARLRAEEGLELGFGLVAVAPDLRLAGRALIAAADRIDLEALSPTPPATAKERSS